ncbi:MAG: histidinol dehydrogenase [Planctomycetota bacterium]|nr:histidinol dehydrogenase [Planctomycetota bacterium]MDA1179505.1 histidinol dehydrogenase [Planctomycetota bacterium]
MALDIRQWDTRHANVQPLLDALRESLSPRGDMVSEAGRRKTRAVFGAELAPQAVVERICHDVRVRGLDAVLEFSRQLDGATLAPQELQVPVTELERAHRTAHPSFLQTLRSIIANISEFQRAILHQDVTVERPQGVRLQQRYEAIQRVGICVPGGAAAYPSTVLMAAVPAQAAGVGQIAVVAPPTPFGAYNDDLLATCYEVGIREVYRVGGAQGVAALAYGVQGLPKVDKIVGPGNLFVALAKKHVFGEVDIDSIAGPSEVVILADESAQPRFLAADLLAQAEHSPGASILVTWSDTLLQAVTDELELQLQHLTREDLTRTSLAAYGALIQTADSLQAVNISNLIAPEHLQLCVEDPHSLLKNIRNAGAVFLGHHSPVAVGDYAAGPSHVLPTGGTARWASGLSSNSFLRSYSVIEYSPEGLSAIADDVRRLADKEGLTAHRNSVDVRFP